MHTFCINPIVGLAVGAATGDVEAYLFDMMPLLFPEANYYLQALKLSRIILFRSLYLHTPESTVVFYQIYISALQSNKLKLSLTLSKDPTYTM